MERLPGPLAYRFWNALAKGLFALRTRVKVIHRERSGDEGPWILASNHISHFDPPLLSSVVKRRVDWMAMQELFGGKLTTALFESVGAFPVKRSRADRGALKTVMQRLKADRVVGIFPEGGLRAGASSILEGAPMKPGIAMLSVMANAPILPCVLIGTDRLYRAKNWLPGRRIPIWVLFGEPILPDSALEKTEAIQKTEAELKVVFVELKRRAVKEFGLKEEDLPQTPQARMGEQP